MKLWELAAEAETTEARAQQERVERFLSGRDVQLDERLARWDVLASLAHARALLDAGLLSPEEHAQLHQALVELLDEIERGRFRLAPEDEDVHTAVENFLAGRLGPLGGQLGAGRSRNDQIATVTRLHTKHQLLEIAAGALGLVDTLLKFAEAHERVPLAGRTHGQPAMPTTVGHWALCYAEALLDALGPLRAALERVDRGPLGAAAGYGSPLPLDRAQTAKALGFSEPVVNTLWAVQGRGVVEFWVVSALAGLGLVIGRFATDLIELSREDCAVLELPEAFTTGSSLMPQKRNPDVAEVARARAAALVGKAVELALIVKGLPFGYWRDTQETKGPLLDALDATQELLEALTVLVQGLRVNEAQAERTLTPELFATDAALERAQTQRVPFREAYRQVKAELQRGTLRLRVPPPSEWLEARARLLGSPGSLGLAALEGRLGKERAFWRARRESFQRAVQALIDGGEGGASR